MTGPLTGVRVVELASIGPGPHASMVLSDLGAEVVRIVRPNANEFEYSGTFTFRGRISVSADLKDAEDFQRVLELIERADVLIEGLRPGTLERLGLDPAQLTATNPGLVVARMTGWGQSGPLARTAGHDINYISLTGALHAVGPAEYPVPPLNLVGDFGGGSLYLLTSVLAALVERARTGRGQVLDVAMIDGAASLTQSVLEFRAQGMWTDQRAANLLDGGAPFYRTYPCADGRFVAVGAIEPQFYAELLRLLGVDASTLGDQNDHAAWPATAATLAAVFVTRSRDEWAAVFAESDACVTPVLTFAEAPAHPHVAARRAVLDGPYGPTAGVAPRLGGVEPGRSEPSGRRAELAEVLTEWSTPR